MSVTESTGETQLSRTGVDALALKPAECDVSRALAADVDVVTIDYEGRDHVPNGATLRELAAEKTLRMTTPVRATGYDPTGDDSLDDAIPAGVGRVLVAGHGAYLDDDEQARAVAPRLGEAVQRHPEAWVGTEAVERVALATGATQFELLSRSTHRDVRALRAAGFDGEVAVYAPTVLTDDEDDVLDAVGAYAARRGPVRRALPDAAADGESVATDASATGRARDVLSKAVRDYALVGDVATVREQVAGLHDVGVDHVVAYPARGLDAALA
ncbi:luciferase [Halorubellus sp. JP-L1]|uniref:DUF7388 family protein n=1 Tax=Halorubellus sp. JP-L1 TaxID=2715753 RepID=UPI00140E373E|nr:luciferase [Halorubellus sp. JP-L1]NHN42567.1 luciferase [Halorubellus sp. JP-L1]